MFAGAGGRIVRRLGELGNFARDKDDWLEECWGVPKEWSAETDEMVGRATRCPIRLIAAILLVADMGFVKGAKTKSQSPRTAGSASAKAKKQATVGEWRRRPARGCDEGGAFPVVLPHRNTAAWVRRACARSVCRTGPARRLLVLQPRAPVADSSRERGGLILAA